MKKVFSIFWQAQVKNIQTFVWLLVFLVVVTVAGNIVAPWYYARIVDALSIEQSLRTLIFSLLGMYSVMMVVRTVLWIPIRYWIVRVEVDAMQYLEEYVHGFLLYLDQHFFDNNFAGSLTNKSNKFIRAYEIMFDEFVFNLVPTIVTFVGIMIVVMTFLPIAAFALLLYGIIYVYTMYRFSEWKRQADIIEANHNSRMTGFLADTFTNIATIKTFANELFEKVLYATVNEKRKKARIRSWFRANVRDNSINALHNMMRVAMIGLSLWAWSRELISIGEVVLLFSYSGYISDHLYKFSQVIKNTMKAYADAEEMIEIFDHTAAVQDVSSPETLRVTQGCIEFTDVDFYYPESYNPLFSQLAVTIPAGQKVGLVGVSGGGKTTLTKLLFRFMDIQAGSIRIDGQDISQLKQQDLRNVISYVPQEPLLFHRSVGDNISYGNPTASFEDIQHAAKLALADAFITKLSDGYDTKVGERGVKLSGGQRQRVAIARALLEKTPILVLDEATSALDSESERDIQQALDNLLADKNRTMLVIAHRLSTVLHLDRILVMEDGIVVQDGTPEDLLAQEGRFRELCYAQIKDFVPLMDFFSREGVTI